MPWLALLQTWGRPSEGGWGRCWCRLFHTRRESMWVSLKAYSESLEGVNDLLFLHIPLKTCPNWITAVVSRPIEPPREPRQTLLWEVTWVKQMTPLVCLTVLVTSPPGSRNLGPTQESLFCAEEKLLGCVYLGLSQYSIDMGYRSDYIWVQKTSLILIFQ